MRILAAAVLYFAIVFGVGFILGPVRVLWLEPWLGATAAVLCEVPFLVLAMILAARWAPRKAGLAGGIRPLVAMGVSALVLQQIADAAVAMALRGITPSEQIGYFATPAGIVYGAALLAFAAMPAVVNARS